MNSLVYLMKICWGFFFLFKDLTNQQRKHTSGVQLGDPVVVLHTRGHAHTPVLHTRDHAHTPVLDTRGHAHTPGLHT